MPRNWHPAPKRSFSWQRNGAEPPPQMPARWRGRAAGTHGWSLMGKGLCPGALRPEHPIILPPWEPFGKRAHTAQPSDLAVCPPLHIDSQFCNIHGCSSDLESQPVTSLGSRHHSNCPLLVVRSRTHFCLTHGLQLPVSVPVPATLPPPSLFFLPLWVPALSQPLSCTRVAGWGGHNWMVGPAWVKLVHSAGLHFKGAGFVTSRCPRALRWGEQSCWAGSATKRKPCPHLASEMPLIGMSGTGHPMQHFNLHCYLHRHLQQQQGGAPLCKCMLYLWTSFQIAYHFPPPLSPFQQSHLFPSSCHCSLRAGLVGQETTTQASAAEKLRRGPGQHRTAQKRPC